MYPLSSTAHHVCPCSYPVSHPPSIVYTSFWSCLFPDRDAPGCLPQLPAFEPVSSMAFPTWPSFLPSFLPRGLSPPGYLHPWSQPPYQGKKCASDPQPQLSGQWLRLLLWEFLGAGV